MSNDSESPPPLRLKPRLQPDSSQNAAASPSQTSEPSAETSSAAISPASSAASEPSSPLPDPASTEEPGRLKLKPRNAPSFASVDPAAPPVPSVLPTPPVSTQPPPTAPKPSLPAAALSAPPFARAPGRPPVPVTPLPPGGLVQSRPKPSISSQPADEEGGAFKVGLWAFLAVGILALGLLAFLVIRFISKHEPKGETVVMKQSSPAVAGASATSADSVTPEPHVDAVAPVTAQATPPPSSPQTLYGKAIVKAKDVVAKNDAHAADATEILDDKQPPAAVKPKAEPSATAQVKELPTPAPVPAVTEVAVEEEKPVVVDLPTPTPTPRPTPTPPPPSSAFRYFVVQMKVNGVFQGSDPRAVLNGRIFHEGEMVDPALGIMLIEIDTEAKKLIFREPSGAVMPRRY